MITAFVLHRGRSFWWTLDAGASIIGVMPTVNEKILDAQIKHSIFLERYKAGVLKKIVGLLNKSEADLIETIAKRLAGIEERGFDLGPASTKRLQKLLAEIVAKREEVYTVLGEQALAELVDFTHYEADFQVRLTDNAGANLSLALPSNAQLKAIVTAQPFQGRILKDWFDGLAQKDADRVKDAIRIGLTQNQTVDDMVRRIRGTKAKKYQDGILEISRRDAAAVVRTAVSHSAQRARTEVFNANADIVHKVQYVATLDSRTTLYCATHDGKVYDLGQQPVLPAHWNCRSVYVVYFDGDERGKRSSAFGPVPDDTDYETFLKG